MEAKYHDPLVVERADALVSAFSRVRYFVSRSISIQLSEELPLQIDKSFFFHKFAKLAPFGTSITEVIRLYLQSSQFQIRCILHPSG